jgi:hypothetical protein
MAAVDLTAGAENTNPTGLCELIEIPTAIVIDAVDGGTVTFKQVITAGVLTVKAKKDDKVLLYLVNGEAAENTVTIAGSGGYADQGDLVLTLAASKSYLVQIESARFVQSDGLMHISTGDAVNVTMAVINLH